MSLEMHRRLQPGQELYRRENTLSVQQTLAPFAPSLGCGIAPLFCPSLSLSSDDTLEPPRLIENLHEFM